MINYISAMRLSRELGWIDASIRRLACNMGLPPHRMRMPGEGRGQCMVVFTPEEADLIRKEVQKRNRSPKPGIPVYDQPFAARQGVLYLVQPDPEKRPERMKLGFTTSINGRLLEFCQISPSTVLVKSWPCRGSWEQTARDFITRDSAPVPGPQQEVFDGDVEKAREFADEFFRLAPSV